MHYVDAISLTLASSVASHFAAALQRTATARGRTQHGENVCGDGLRQGQGWRKAM